MPPSPWTVSSCVCWQEGGLILRAQADPGRSLVVLFDSGLSPGLLGVWYFCLSQLLGIAFPSSRTLGGGCAHPGNGATVGNLDSWVAAGGPSPTL